MLKKLAFSAAMLLPGLAFAGHHHHHHHFQWAAPEIDGGATILGLAILGGILSFMKKRAQ